MTREMRDKIQKKAGETGIPLHVLVELGLSLDSIPGEDPGGNDVFMNLHLPGNLLDTIRETIPRGGRSGFYRRLFNAWVNDELELRLCTTS